MKKFLSLVLALIMTMSLVTIGAGATEYRDLTDKDEIQYEEAVAVLNRIGVITGYEDGSFRPETELTRGAAAKIIVSLLIGPEAASNLPNATAPYPDVPASHTFAGVISYCKTAGIISGYGDGTFKPGNSLTGFAFAKMLLGALGYKSEIEGFVDTGWTMNVAKVGNVTGLFDRLDFDGSAAVNREEACQLALNTLKATMVTYGGTTVISGAQNLAVQGTQAMYVTSNNREINANINRRVISAQNNELTLEFGEEHFKDLRLEHDKYDPAYDEFGHPSDEWSYKKVTIGTFKLPADFTYTTQVAYREDSVATKEKALGLRGYDTYSTDHKANYTNWSSAAGGVYNYNSPFADATQITISGWDARVLNSSYKQGTVPAATKEGNLFSYDADKVTASNKEEAPSLSEIADLTDNGVTVEVYVCPVDADFITNVVVTRTQLMKVKRIGSDYVSLEDIEPDSRDPREAGDLPAIVGYNAFSVDNTVIDVKDNNYDPYNVLKDLKAGDYVAVVPYTADDGKTYEVGVAYVPETVSGHLSDVGIYNNATKPEGSATSITIGGTKYIINEWNKDMLNVKKAQIKATRKDVTGYLAADGTVLYTTEIGNSDAWMIVGDYYQGTASSGKVEWFVHGWTIGNEEVDLNLGTIRKEAEKYAPGELVRYQLAAGGNGEYELTKPNINGVSRYYFDGSQTSWSQSIAYEPVLTKKVNNVDQKSGEGIYNVAQYVAESTKADKSYEINAANSLIPLEDYWNYNIKAGTQAVKGGGIFSTEWSKTNPTGKLHEWSYNRTTYKDDGVKFIFVNFDSVTGEVDYISYRKDAQNVSTEELAGQNLIWANSATNTYGPKNSGYWVVSPAEAYVNKDGHVEAVVIKREPAVADLSNVVIITSTAGLDSGKTTTGADETPLSDYAAREYVQGPDFSEVKTGYFDKSYNVGDILTIRSVKDNRMECKYFNSAVWNDRNPDAFKAEGISKLTSAGNLATSKIAFYVGQAAGNKVTNLKGDSLLGTDASILGNYKVEGDSDDLATSYKGLIKVAGAKWIDLRADNSKEIRSLGDLYDYDLDTVKLHVLVNGNKDTDGFRRAYAIVVMNAVPEADKALTPELSITAGIDYVSQKVEATKGGIDDAWAYTYTVKAPAGSKVDLTAVLAKTADKYGIVTYDWYNSAGLKKIGTDAQSLQVTAPAKDQTLTLFLRATNKDTSKKDVITAEYLVRIQVVGTDGGTTPGGTVSDIVFVGDTATRYDATIDSQSWSVSAAGDADDGKLIPDFTVKKPDWAASSTSGSKFTAKVYRNGGSVPNEDITTAKTFTSGSASDKTVGFSDLIGSKTNYLAADKVKVEIQQIDWDAVSLKFVDENGKELKDFTTAVVTANGTTAAPLSFTVKSTADSGSVKVEYVSGLKEAPATTSWTVDFSDVSTKTIAVGNVQADNMGYVTFKVTGMGAVKEKIQVTAASAALLNGTGKQLNSVDEKVAFYLVNDDLTTPTTAGADGTVKGELWAYAAETTMTNPAISVSVKDRDGKTIGTVIIKTAGIAGAKKVGDITLSKSWEIQDTDVTVAKAAKCGIDAAASTTTLGAVGSTLTVKFERAMKYATGKGIDDIYTVAAGSGATLTFKPGTVKFDGTTFTAEIAAYTAGTAATTVTFSNLVTDDAYEIGIDTAKDVLSIANANQAITVS